MVELSRNLPRLSSLALLGLLGSLGGEQILPVARHLLNGDGLARAIGLADCKDHVLGQLPGRRDAAEPGAPGDTNPPKS